MGGGVVVATLTSAAEEWAITKAQAVGVVADAFTAPIVSMGVSPERIHHVPNWNRSVPPDLSILDTRQRFGWTDDRQVVLHAGNIGFKQGLEQVIEAARLAESRHEPVRFILEGDGNQASDIRAAATGLSNLDFIPVQPPGLYASLLAAADILLLSERPTQVDMSLPSKLTSYFASGRPIVAAVPPEGVSAAEVARSNAGLVVSSGRPDQLLAALDMLRREPGTAARLGAAGPIFAEAHSSAAVCLARAERFVDALVSAESPTEETTA
jgi:glycosyltransferase involved in cell wall biosynthesis